MWHRRPEPAAAFSVAHQREAGLILHDLLYVELHRLEIARRAGRLQTGAFELSRHIARGLEMFRAAGVAALHVVVRQVLDMRPPAVAFGFEIGGRIEEQRRRRQAITRQEFFHLTPALKVLYSARRARN